MRFCFWWIVLTLSCSVITGCGSRAKAPSVSPPGAAGAADPVNPPDVVRYWRYVLAGVKNNTVLDMDGVSVIFEGVPYSGQQSGGLPVAGPGRIGSPKTGRSGEFQYLYIGRVAIISFGGRSFQLEEKGTILVAGKNRFRLEGEKKVIVLRKNGTAGKRKIPITRFLSSRPTSRAPKRNAAASTKRKKTHTTHFRTQSQSGTYARHRA